MSGKKSIAVDESAWFRRRRQAKRLREVRSDMAQLVDDIRSTVDADLERVLTQVEERDRRNEELVGRLSERTQRFEAEVHERMAAQSRHFEGSLRETVGELRQETRERLAEQERAWRSELDAERRHRQDEMRQVRTRLGAVEERDQRAAAAASDFVSDARAIHDHIRDVLPHERLAPGELARLERPLIAAQDNLSQGMSQAALATAQDAFFGLSDFRVELELRDREWRRLRVEARTALLQVQGLIEQSAMRETTDEQGAVLEGAKVDVDFWTDGELTRLREDVAAALSDVEGEDVPMDLDALREVIERRAPQFEQRLADAVELADLEHMASQLRVNLADTVVQTLFERAGYAFVAGTYDSDDQREAFYAKLVHPNGSEIVVDVSPQASGSGASVLRLLSYDRDQASAEDRMDRARAIARELRDEGLSVADPEAETGEPDPAFRDLEALKRRESPRAVAKAG